MGRLRKLLDLPAADRRLLLAALPLAVGYRLALWLLPFRIVSRVNLPSGAWDLGLGFRSSSGGRRSSIAGRPSPVAGRQSSPSPERISWAVSVVSSYIPRATCLTRALAAQSLLARHGYQAQLRIGVAKGAAGQLEAHAWLEHDGRALIGGTITGRFVPLA